VAEAVGGMSERPEICLHPSCDGYAKDCSCRKGRQREPGVGDSIPFEQLLYTTYVVLLNGIVLATIYNFASTILSVCLGHVELDMAPTPDVMNAST
jgi:hypothetical protein